MSVEIRALLFDVFGTVVDWRTPIVREAGALAGDLGPGPGDPGDWSGLADAWRAAYYEGIADVREGRRGWCTVEHILREALDPLCDGSGLAAASPGQRDRLAGVWRRLDPWPDAVAGLRVLRRARPTCTLSNGNLSLLVPLSRHAGLDWDMTFTPDVLGCYKPREDAYLGAARLLGLAPDACMMVATHARDLRAAAAAGLATAYVRRPLEYGPATDKAPPDAGTDIVVDDLTALAATLGTAGA